MAIQDHIHLDTDIGGAPENAPVLKWTVTQRQVIDTILSSFNRGMNGTAYFAVKMGYDGPMVFKDLGYTLKVTWSEYLTLRGLFGREVYVVDNEDHPDDGSDHTAVVRTMVLQAPARTQMINQIGEYYLVDIYLIDKDTTE